MAKKPTPQATPEPAASPDPRTRSVDALLALCAEGAWDTITLEAIATRAGLTLADLRDLFPSKGAMLGVFIRRIDRIVLEGADASLAGESPRERVMDLMLRRFDALAPYRAALRSLHAGFAHDLMGLAALNQQALNSWRYLLASVGIETEGPLGFLRLQGAILVFAKVFPIFLADESADLAQTMAALERELKRGEGVLRRAEEAQSLLKPVIGFFEAARRLRRERREAAPGA